MQRDRPDVDALARAELPVDVVDDLLGLQVRVVVGEGDRLRVPVQPARAERADHEVRALERLVDRRRLVQPAGLRLEVRDVERVRVHVAVPPDDVERVVVEHVVLVAAPDAHLDLVLAPVAVREQLGRRVEVALRERRVLEQLPVAVAVAVRGLDLARRVEGKPALRPVEAEAVGRPARDHDVVVPAVGQRAEHRLEHALALVDEDDLVALAVAVEVVGLRLRDADAHLDVGVVLQHAAAQHCVALGLEARGVGEPVHVRLGHPLLELDRRELAHVLDAAGRPQVVEDRLVAAEALEAEDLLHQQRRRAVAGARRVGIAELDVALGRDLAEVVVAHQRFPLSSCSRSIASKRALKFPSPKPRAPCRSMISKNTVGRSPIGLVKICSR